MKTKDFFAFRRWFNSLFSLSFNGKFVGLGRLVERGIYDLFVHKLTKILRKADNRMCKPLDDVIVFRLSGHTVKLYNR